MKIVSSYSGRGVSRLDELKSKGVISYDIGGAIFKQVKKEDKRGEDKMRRVDIMTDIETLGTDSDSTIIQIAAIAFNIQTGEHLSQFNLIADITKNENPIKSTGSTIKWWLNTNKELLAELINIGEISSEDVLRSFHQWIIDESSYGLHKTYLWGNGILFDNKIIQHQLESIGLEYPIHYKNDRDVRTLLELASYKMGVSEQDIKDVYEDDSLVEHDAFDDVIYQISLATGCFKQLINE